MSFDAAQDERYMKYDVFMRIYERTYLTMKLLGNANVRNYDGSWSEWGNNPNTPVEQ